MHAMQHVRIITLVTSALLTSQVSGTCQAETAQQRGKVIAQGLCSRCHAIETTGESPHPAAPRFRSLDAQTDLSKLAQRIRGGLLTGHEDMPMFRFDRDDADAMAAYIRSIQGP
jgi:mono/diheme cytochrome c family protein